MGTRQVRGRRRAFASSLATPRGTSVYAARLSGHNAMPGFPARRRPAALHGRRASVARCRGRMGRGVRRAGCRPQSSCPDKGTTAARTGRRSAPAQPRYPARRTRDPRSQHLPGSGRPLGSAPVCAHRADADPAPRCTPHRIVPSTGNLRKLKISYPNNQLSLVRSGELRFGGRASPAVSGRSPRARPAGAWRRTGRTFPGSSPVGSGTELISLIRNHNSRSDAFVAPLPLDRSVPAPGSQGKRAIRYRSVLAGAGEGGTC